MPLTPTGPNAEQIRFWNEVNAQKWIRFQSVIDEQIGSLGRVAMDRAGIRAGERALDVGCGCGGTTLEIARRVGPAGFVVGIDLSAPMLAEAERRARESHVSNARFQNSDAQTHAFAPGEFDVGFSRFGVMFFADPGAAFANIRKALKPGGRLAFVCWRAMPENVWAFAPFAAARDLLPAQPPPDPHAPGPFAFADSARLKSILEGAGFADVKIEKLDTVMHMAATAKEAAQFTLGIGPLARAAADADDQTRAKIVERVTVAMQKFETAEGVSPPAACWLVGARV